MPRPMLFPEQEEILEDHKEKENLMKETSYPEEKDVATLHESEVANSVDNVKEDTIQDDGVYNDSLDEKKTDAIDDDTPSLNVVLLGSISFLVAVAALLAS